MLKRARQTNSFLQAVPDAAVTHFVLGYTPPADAVLINYIIKNPDTTAGVWSMSSVHFQLPDSAVVAAYGRAVESFGPGRCRSRRSARCTGTRRRRAPKTTSKKERWWMFLTTPRR